MGSDAPSCIADMKLILGGKFLDNSESLEGTQRRPFHLPQSRVKHYIWSQLQQCSQRVTYRSSKHCV